MTSPNDPRRRQIVVAGVQANVGTSVVVGGLRGQGYNAVDAGVYSGGRVDVLVAGAAMSNVAPAQQAIQRAERAPVLAIVADNDRALPARNREAWRMVRGDTRGNINVPFVPEWRAQKDPPAQAAAAPRDPRARRDIKGFLKATKEIGELGERLADELMPARAPERRQAAPQRVMPQFATVPSAPFQPPQQADSNWRQQLPAAAEIVDSLRRPVPQPAVPVAAATAALGSILDYAKPIPFGHLSGDKLGSVHQGTAPSAKGTHSPAYQGVKLNEVSGSVRLR